MPCWEKRSTSLNAVPLVHNGELRVSKVAECWSLIFSLRADSGAPVPSNLADEAFIALTTDCERLGLQVGGGYSVPKLGERPEISLSLRAAEAREFLRLSKEEQVEFLRKPLELRPDLAPEWLFQLVIESAGDKDDVESSLVSQAFSLLGHWAERHQLSAKAAIEPLEVDFELEARFSDRVTELFEELEAPEGATQCGDRNGSEVSIG
jgi:hypothetical protein